MGTAIESLEVDLEHDIDEQYQYQPGEILRGYISVTTSRQTFITKIYISITGQGAVAWEDPQFGSFNANEEYINAKHSVEDRGLNDPLLLAKGEHKFPFEYQLPDNLPSSFIGKFGSVTYVLKVIVNGEKSETNITSEPFLVIRKAEIPDTSRKSESRSMEQRFWGLCSTGKIKFDITIDKVGVCPGEDIYIQAEVANTSPLYITAVQASIVMNTLYHARKKLIPFRQVVNKRRDEQEMTQGDGRKWHNVRLTVPPYIPESNLDYCDIIEISYSFQFRVEISGGKELRAEIPLLIGSKPKGLEIPTTHNPLLNKNWGSPGDDIVNNGNNQHEVDYSHEANEWHRGIVPELRPFDTTMKNPLFENTGKADLPEEIIESSRL